MNTILHPANGFEIIVPSEQILLGIYYQTLLRENDPGEGKIFGDMYDIEHALAEKAITLHSKIKYRWRGLDEAGKPASSWHDTTPGRVILGQVIPRNRKVPFEVVNKLMTKREISKLIDTVYRHCLPNDTVAFCAPIITLA